jgi:hypothetical protein
MTLRSITPPARWLLALATLLATLVALGGQASASRTQRSIFQDDRMLLKYGSGVQAAALDDMQALGVDTVHADIYWSSLAPSPNSSSAPKGVDLTDPASYRASRWSIIDSLVRGAQSRGMDVLLTPTAPGPFWGTDKNCSRTERRRARVKGICRPNAGLYGKFVTALARRYSGFYANPAEPGSLPLPKVSRWSIWNEPNLSSWLYPSSAKSGRALVPVSAKSYRALVYAAGTALEKSGHKRDEILLGETAPIGGGSSSIAPVPFYQAIFCVSSSGRRLKGAAAKRLGCPARIKRLPVTGVAHHPYTRATVGSLTAKPAAGNVTIAAIPALRRVLKQGVRGGAISGAVSSQINLTEFGVSSTPPANPRKYGVSLSKQAESINLYEYIAYLNGAVRGVSQYQLEDDHLAAGSHGSRLVFQTGLRFLATRSQLLSGKLGKPKPSRAAYKVPLFVVDKGHRLVVWGGVRGVPTGKVQVVNAGKVVKTVSLRSGYFSFTIGKRKGTWQLRFGKLRSRVASPVKL